VEFLLLVDVFGDIFSVDKLSMPRPVLIHFAFQKTP
jgi:hypothetical protein